MFSFPALATGLLILLSDQGEGGDASWWTSSSWSLGVAQAAQPTSQRQRRSSRQRGPSLHNSNHESTIRNILLPKFKQQLNSNDNGNNSNNPPLTQGNHTSNVAIIVSSSRYWFNYRHVTNALSIYHLLKRGGITDDNIILMLADDIPCNMRNPFRGTIFPRGANMGEGEDLMHNAEIDYSSTDVTVDAFLRVLLGRHLPGEDTTSTTLGSGGSGVRSLPKLDENTNVLVYLTGHGGDNFFKFQDGEELMSDDIASVFSQMYELKRYNELLFISDTCQAFTMADPIRVPGVFSVGSSLKDENSYASHSDPEVGQSVIDRYSKIIKDFVDDAVTMTSGAPFKYDTEATNNGMDGPFDNATVAVMEHLNLHDALVRIPMNHGDLGPSSHVGHADHLCERKMNKVPLSDFFAASRSAREGMTDGHRVEASLWMSDLSVVTDSNDLRQDLEETVEEECIIDQEPDESEQIDRAEQRQRTAQMKPEGMSLFDKKFLAITVGFLLCINISSRIW